ncbi:hypothetical protein V502_06718 [Pseudogymnoascus sp. VKM F-4520 (FW-2644)]|nr:hypothetical protein V502_06718 [Pseudogymnoascus sp. VKM F-4520 (FW-2644)]
MLRQALSARRSIFSTTYRPRHSQIQRSLTTGQRHAFHIFPGLRYNNHSSPYDMTSGIRSSLNTTSRNNISRGVLSTTESEAEMNDIKTKLQDLERRLDRETESRQQDIKFNLSSLTHVERDVSRLYKYQKELREDMFMKDDF